MRSVTYTRAHRCEQQHRTAAAVFLVVSNVLRIVNNAFQKAPKIFWRGTGPSPDPNPSGEGVIHSPSHIPQPEPASCKILRRLWQNHCIKQQNNAPNPLDRFPRMEKLPTCYGFVYGKATGETRVMDFGLNVCTRGFDFACK